MTAFDALIISQLPFTGGSLQDMIDAELCSAHKVDDEDRLRQPEAFDLLDKVSPPFHVSGSASLLITVFQLLEKSPADRINLEAAKNHPYFEEM